MEFLKSKKVVLASASPRRRFILESLCIPFTVIPSTFPETLSRAEFNDPADYAKETSRQKAMEVIEKFDVLSDCLVISADTIVELNGSILEKPRTKAENMEMLKKVENTRHHVHSGVTIAFYKNGELVTHSFSESTVVHFGTFDQILLQEYVESGDGLDKAGGYGLQGSRSAWFAKKIEGCMWNVTGFPTYRFLEEINRFC